MQFQIIDPPGFLILHQSQYYQPLVVPWAYGICRYGLKPGGGYNSNNDVLYIGNVLTSSACQPPSYRSHSGVPPDNSVLS